MKDKEKHLGLFKELTGLTMHVPKQENINPYGYQIARVNRINRYGFDKP